MHAVNVLKILIQYYACILVSIKSYMWNVHIANDVIINVDIPGNNICNTDSSNIK